MSEKLTMAKIEGISKILADHKTAIIVFCDVSPALDASAPARCVDIARNVSTHSKKDMIDLTGCAADQAMTRIMKEVCDNPDANVVYALPFDSMTFKTLTHCSSVTAWTHSIDPYPQDAFVGSFSVSDRLQEKREGAPSLRNDGTLFKL